MQVNKT